MPAPCPSHFLPVWGPTLVMGIMPIALVLLCAGQGRTISSLAGASPAARGAALVGGPSGGEQRGAFLVLFGGLGLWALISIVWISMRSGASPRAAATWRGRGSVWGRGWPSRLCLSSGTRLADRDPLH